MELKNLLNSSAEYEDPQNQFRGSPKPQQKTTSPNFGQNKTQGITPNIPSNSSPSSTPNNNNNTVKTPTNSGTGFQTYIPFAQQVPPFKASQPMIPLQPQSSLSNVQTTTVRAPIQTNPPLLEKANPNFQSNANDTNNGGTNGNGRVAPRSPQIAQNYNKVGLLEGMAAALKTISRYKVGDIKNGISTREGVTPFSFDFPEQPVLLNSEIYSDSKNTWNATWKPETLAKVHPEIYIKDQKNTKDLKRTVGDFRNHLKSKEKETTENNSDLEVWTAPDIPIMHQFACLTSKKNRNCLGCSHFWKSAQSVIEDLRSWGNTDLLKYEPEHSENFMGNLSMHGSFSPQKRESHGCDTINTLFYADDPNASVIWGFIAPQDMFKLTEEDSIGITLFDQRSFIDPTFLETRAKVLYGIQKQGQTVMIPSGWTYFNVRMGKGLIFSASWNILRIRHLPDARRSVEMNRSVGLYRPTNLGSLVIAAAHNKLEELESADNAREKQSVIDFLFRLLPVLKVQVMEELLDERINLTALSVLSYDFIVDQYRTNGGIFPKGVNLHELDQIRAHPIPSLDSFTREDDDELHSCALCKYVLFNTRRSCIHCKGLDLCELCYTSAAKVHPHKFKLVRKIPLDNLLELVDNVKNLISDHEPEETYRETSVPPPQKVTKKRDHSEMASLSNAFERQNTHLIPGAPGTNKDVLSLPEPRMPGQQPMTSENYGDAEVIDCICGNNKDLGFMISCEKCYAWLHGKCVGISKRNEPDEYYCPRCEKRLKEASRYPK
eukprot:TRINITY_DN3498_c0_g2_i2.p1 TRINITY_DN3498_c0_g2~~TRINITY_DN3498_c0_g2_i2.p1  ORF type:complete len:775 (+),score=185.57 TRINITY_DN3498_c0_g2_i2:138-2462(+)